MADITAAMRDYLEADATVAAQVGTRVRRGHGLMSDRQQSYIVIQKTSDAPEPHQGGVTDLVFARVEVHCYAQSRYKANLASEAVKGRLDGASGVTIGDSSVVVDYIQLEDRRELDFLPTDGGEMGEFRDLCTYTIWYRG